MIVKLLTEHHLEFLSLKGGCRGSSESTYVKMPHCWKSHAMAQLCESAIVHVLIYSARLGLTRFIQASLCKIQGLFKDFPTVFKV